MRHSNSVSRRELILTGASVLAAPAFFIKPRRASAAEFVTVQIENGRLRGQNESGVSIFKGIPYAASTAGANRFRPPQPLLPWRGMRDALMFGASAPQAPSNSPERAGFADINTVSEDCLSLNVFTPGAGRSGRRPVMVWLHGGGWWVGAGSAPVLHGLKLAQWGDVVLVTINHRLGAFGHLLLDDKDERFADSGNLGVLDMVAALRWVRQNVAAFGGDPNNVTIFGQSGGGCKVMALLGAPAAKGLFHKAIAQSGSGSLRITGQEEAARLGGGVAKTLDLSRLTGEALQSIPMEQILAAARGLFRPILDGRTFTRHPYDPDAPPTSAAVPLMAGNVATETRIQMAAADRKNFSLDRPEVQRRLSRFFRSSDAETNRVLEAYQDSSPGSSPGDLLGAITTDYIYVRNTRRGATLQSLHAPAYSYIFTRRTPVMDGILRTPHESEVPFIFGTTEAAPHMIGDGPDLAPLTKIMIATWSAFARNANPNNPAIPAWPRHDAKDGFSMMLNVTSSVERNPGGQARAALDFLPYYEYNIPTNYTRA